MIIKLFVDTKTCKTKILDIIQDEEKPIIRLEKNKLILNDSAIKLLNLVAGEEIKIEYVNKTDIEFFPVIRKVSNYEKGNKLCKNGSISFRGECNDSLREYGTEFFLKEYKEGIYILTTDMNDNNIEEHDTEIEEAINEADLKLSEDDSFNIDFSNLKF